MHSWVFVLPLVLSQISQGGRTVLDITRLVLQRERERESYLVLRVAALKIIVLHTIRRNLVRDDAAIPMMAKHVAAMRKSTSMMAAAVETDFRNYVPIQVVYCDSYDQSRML